MRRPVEGCRARHRLCSGKADMPAVLAGQAPALRRIVELLMARRIRLVTLASIAAAITFECSSSTVPDVRLSTDVNLSATPGLIEPVLLSGPPWRWRAVWTVNLTAPEEVARSGDVFVALRTRIAQQDGHVLVELTEEARRLEPQVGMRSVIQFPENVTYDTQADPPTTSHLVMTAHLSDGHGRSEEVSTIQEIAETPCGTKRK